MTRRRLTAVAGTLFCAALAVTLWHDLGRWRLREADRRFRAGDLQGALTAWGPRAGVVGDEPLRAYNRGVARFRLGDLAGASNEFSAAASGGSGDIRQRAHYNLGTTLYRLAEKSAPNDPETAERQLRAAIGSFGAALAIDPGDILARDNLSLVRTRLTLLAQRARDRQGTASPQGKSGQQQPQPEERENGAGKRAGEAAAAKDRKSGAGSRSADRDPDGSGGSKRAELSPKDAERILDEERGREKVSGSLSVNDSARQSSRPKKDW